MGTWLLKVIALLIAILCAGSLFGCAAEEPVGTEVVEEEEEPVPEGAVAYVNGTYIMEDEVDDLVEYERDARGLDGYHDWNSYLKGLDSDEDQYRKLILDVLVERELIHQMAYEKGIELSDEEVNETFATLFGEAGDGIDPALGISADDARSALRERMLRRALASALAEESEDEPSYADGTILLERALLAMRTDSDIRIYGDEEDAGYSDYDDYPDDTDYDDHPDDGY